MNLRELEYFIAVADLGHFRAASEHCCVSQPTLSGQLRKLEEELGHSFFDRDTRSVRLTSFGKEVLPIAREIISGSHKLLAKAKELQDPFVGRVSIGLFPTLGPWLMPRLAEPLQKIYPQAEFFLNEEKSPVLQKKLLSGEIDAAFLALPQKLNGISFVPIFSEAFWVAVPDVHSWAQKKSVTGNELASVELLLLEDGHCLRDQALDLCHRYGVKEKGYYRATGLETLRQMVRMGHAITLIPRLAIPDHIEQGIVYIELNDIHAKRDIALCFRETHPRKKFFLDIIDQIKKMCGKELPVVSMNMN